MRKTINLFLILIPFVASSQSLKENKTDEFTKASVKKTEFETFSMTTHAVCYYQLEKIDSFYNINIKLNLHGTVFSIDKGNELMFKTDSNEIITLNNLKYSLTCTGCGAIGFGGSGAQGIEVTFPLTQSLIEKLKNSNLVKYRIYTNNGYAEEDIKPKHSEIFKKAIALIE